MENKDLVIGKKYLQKGSIEVYYLGESERGDSIVQPTDGINGVVSLKECHPELKDIIGSDKFWGYYNIHLELKEIEPKYLTVNELVDGEIYFGKHMQLDVIFIHNKYEIYDNRNFYKRNYPDVIKEITEANQEQKDWLNACIKADKFVPKDSVNKVCEFEVLKQEGKLIEKWSIRSYVVPLQDRLLTRDEPLTKFEIYQIIKNQSNTSYITCNDGRDINFQEKDAEEIEGIKWFATFAEAKEFSDNLKNKPSMNYKFKVGDKVKVVKTGYGIGNIVDYPLTVTSLGTYPGGPGYSVEPKIGNCLSGTCNGMIGEKSFELYEEKPMQDKRWVSLEDWEAETRKLNLDVYDLADYINEDKVPDWVYSELQGYCANEKAHLLISKWDKEEKWTPQVNDWVVIENWDYATIELNQVCQILNVYENYTMPYEILLNKDQYGKKGSWYFKKSNFRKALPHEIPNQDNPGVGSEVLNTDFNEVNVGHCDTFMGMKIYSHIAYQPLQSQCQWSLHYYSPKNDGLDLSLRDEKEVNVNEIKLSNNNISKLNLSLNN